MSDAPLVLLIEDEAAMRRLLRVSLEAHGFRFLAAENGAAGLALAASERPDVVLLDLGLPDADGLDVTRQLREWSRVPVIVLSARGREDDKVAALDAGADDYVTKPFGVNELLARVRVALRHAAARSEPESPVVEAAGLRVDRARHEVTVDGREVRLTPTEFELLVLFAQNAGRVLTHRQILKEIWGPAYAHQSHTVRVHVAELRKKIEDDPARPRRLITEPGVGYRLREG